MATLSRRRLSAADSDSSPPKLTVSVIPSTVHASKTQIQALLVESESSRCDRLSFDPSDTLTKLREGPAFGIDLPVLVLDDAHGSREWCQNVLSEWSID